MQSSSWEATREAFVKVLADAHAVDALWLHGISQTKLTIVMHAIRDGYRRDKQTFLREHAV